MASKSQSSSPPKDELRNLTGQQMIKEEERSQNEWCPVLAVLRPVRLYHLPLSAVSLDREVDAQDVVARLDDFQYPTDTLLLLLGGLTGFQTLHQLVLHDCGASVEESLHHVEKVRIIVLVHGLAVAAVAQKGGGRWQSRLSSRRGGTGGQDAARSPEDSMCDKRKIHIFLGAPTASSDQAGVLEARMGEEERPPAKWRHLELTWQDGCLKPSTDKAGNQGNLSSSEEEAPGRVEPRGQKEEVGSDMSSKPNLGRDNQCSASIHEYLESCFPTARTQPKSPKCSKHQSSSTVPLLSNQSQYLTTWTLSQALILRGRQHRIQSATSPEKTLTPQTPPKDTQTAASASSSTPELFSPVTSTPGDSAELFSQPCPSLRAEEGGIVVEVTTEGVLCSQEVEQQVSRSPQNSPSGSPDVKKAHVSENRRTETSEVPLENKIITGLRGTPTLLSRCDKRGVCYSVLVTVVHPCHLKEVKVKSGAAAGSFVPLASIVVTDQSGVEMKVVLWRRAAFWVLTVSPGDILLITGLQVNEDRWRGETVLQSTFSSKLLNLGPITASTSPAAPQRVDACSLNSLCCFLRERRPLLVSSKLCPPQDLNRLPYVPLRSLRVNTLVHALLRVTHTHISTDWRSEAESRCRAAVQLKAVLTVEQPDGQHGTLLLWGAAVDWLPRVNRDTAAVWDFRVLLVRDSLTSEVLELHSTPWSSLQALDLADRRAQNFLQPQPTRPGNSSLELDLDTLLSQKYSGEVELRVQVIAFQFQDYPPSQDAPQPVLNSSTSLDDILVALSGDITYTGCGRCSAELDTDANGIYLPCYPCLPHTAVRRYYRPGMLTVSGRSSSQVCVKVPPVPLQKVLEAPPDKLNKSSAPGSEVKHIQVAAEKIQTLLSPPKKTFILTVRSHFLCDENSVPINQDFTLLDLLFPS
nr:shieldin complex subunit 2 [Labrus bergylta]